MDEAGLRRHGGRLTAAKGAFPDAPEPWLDLSTGVNPQAWRGPRATLADLQRLPDPADLAVLEAIAALAFGVDPARVVAVAGAEAGLRLLPQLTGARSLAIAGPTYGGHEEAWRAAGAEVMLVGRGDLAATSAEARLLVNPNNPDGATSIPPALRARGDWLIVDEAFVDAEPELSLAAEAGGRLIVLRSFGKFYGLPGVRLGFILAAPEVAARARQLIGDWPVSADALALGVGAYGDLAWAQAMRLRLARSRTRLEGLLARHGFEPVGGTALFCLTRRPDAMAWFQGLARQGVLVRPFDHDPQLLRFGLPKPSAWRRLEAALEAARP